MAAPIELAIELVEHDVAEQRGERTALRDALIRTHHHSIRHHYLGFEHPVDKLEQSSVFDFLPEPRE